MIGVTIIIGITISLYGNYISIIIMPTLIADASLLQFHLTVHLMLPHFYSDSGIRHRIIQGSGLGVGWELVLSQHDAKLSEQLKVFSLCFRPTLHPDSGLPRLSYSGTRLRLMFYVFSSLYLML